MPNDKLLSNLGSHVYGLAAVTLGLIGFAWGDFATPWQPVPASVPHRVALAYAYAACLLLAGAAMQWRVSARLGAIALAVLYCLPAGLWASQVIGSPGNIGTWGNVAEEFALVCAGVISFAMAAGWTKGLADAARVCACIFALGFLALGLEHFMLLSGVASFVPKWMPPNQRFWVIVTGLGHILAGLAILAGVLDLLAARLLTAMIAVFGLLVWLPRLIAQPHLHMNWGGNGVNLALMGAAWVVADSIARRRQRAGGTRGAVCLDAAMETP